MQHHFKQLFEYDKWASQTLLDKFERQFPQNSRIYELLSHVFSAQRIWLDRCLGLPQSVERFREQLPDEIKQDFVNYHQEWVEFINQLQPGDFNKTVKYRNSQGEYFENRLSDIITHVINHGTHHRGAIVVLMKEEGFVPPPLDFIFYTNKKNKA